eukprot:TRINITY_DN854_c0_g1_i1.p1 TRINITY_DN854_c0_g1~~TRINITY_DN854_c0_g1_i1.p1  ORF type:complete len:2525 (-),score=734.09 TRINITY_DN854_c0_g1_i1:3672-10397(-)
MESVVADSALSYIIRGEFAPLPFIRVRFNASDWSSSPIVPTIGATNQLTINTPVVPGTVTRPVNTTVWVTIDGAHYVATGHNLLFYTQPTISSISPTTGPHLFSTPVTVIGTNFLPVTDTSQISFSVNNRTECLYVSGSKMVCSTPLLAADTLATVEIALNGIQFTTGSNKFFRALAPTVTVVSPKSGYQVGGSTVTITGTQYFATTQLLARFSSGVINPPVVINATRLSLSQMSLSTPSFTGYNVGLNNSLATHPVNLEISTNGGATFTSNGKQYVLQAVPVFNTISPSTGPSGGGTLISIVGTFVTAVDGIQGRVNDSSWTSSPVSVTQVSSTLLTMVTPAILNNVTGAETFSVQIALNGQDFVVTPLQFVYHESVTLTGFSVLEGPTEFALPVTVYGSNFVESNSITWSLGGVKAVCTTFINSSAVICPTPKLPVTTANIEISLNGLQFTNYGNTFQFRTVVPSMAAVSPGAGPVSGGTVLTIAGQSMKSTGVEGSLLVRYSSLVINPPVVMNATAVGTSGTRITAVTPSFSGFTFNIGSAAATHSVTLEVSTNGGASFRNDGKRLGLYESSQFSSATPISGFESGGTTVSIIGEFPQSGDNVYARFNSSSWMSAALPVTLLSTTKMVLATPNVVNASVVTAPFTASIQVAVNGQQFVNTEIEYLFLKQTTLSGISVTRGPVDLGTPVILTGTNFINLASIKASFGAGEVNKVPCTFLTNTTLSCVTPKLPTTTTNVEVSMNGIEYTSGSNLVYRTALPSLQSVSPLSAVVTGGTRVTVNGNDLLGGFVEGAMHLRLSSAAVSPGVLVNVTSDVQKKVIEFDLPSMSGYSHGISGPSSIHHDVGVEVSTNGGGSYTSSGLKLRLYAVPVFNLSSPDSGPKSGGTTLDVYGAFANTPDAVRVRFNSSSYTSAAVTATVISVTHLRVVTPSVVGSPAGPMDVQLQIALNGRDYIDLGPGLGFKYYDNPTISSLSHTRGPALMNVPFQIYGVGFLDLASSRVAMNGVAAACSFASSTEMRCVTPSLGVTTAEVEIALNGRQFTVNSGALFSMVNPGITRFTPQSGPFSGGTECLVEGFGLLNTSVPNALRVKFTSPTVPQGVKVYPEYISDTSLRLTTPNFAVLGWQPAILNNNWQEYAVSVHISSNGGASFFVSNQKLQLYRESEFRSVSPTATQIGVGNTVIKMHGLFTIGSDNALVRLRNADSNEISTSVSVTRESDHIVFSTPAFGNTTQPSTSGVSTKAAGGGGSLAQRFIVEFANNGRQFTATNQSLIGYPQMQVLSVSPKGKTPKEQTKVTISGTGFVDTGQSMRVELGTGNVFAVESMTSTQIVVTSDISHAQGEHVVRISADGGQHFFANNDVVFSVLVDTILCPKNTEFFVEKPTDVTDCMCKLNFYVPSGQPGVECLPCPKNAVCNGRLSKPFAMPGHFSTDNGLTFSRCALLESCLGGNSSSCLTGYSGRLCGSCDVGFYSLGDRCFKCEDGSDVQFYLLAVIVVMFMLWSRHQVRKSIHKRGGDIVSLSIAHLQVMSTFADYRLQWPSGVKTVFDVFSFSNLSIDVTAPECQFEGWNYETKFWLTMAMPLVLVTGVFVRILFEQLRNMLVDRYGEQFKAQFPSFCAMPGHDLSDFQFVLSSIRFSVATWFFEMGEDFKTSLTFMINETLLTLALLYIILCKRVLETFDCTDLGNGLVILDAVPDEECWKEGGLHMRMLFPGIIFSLIYALGIPILFFEIMRRWKSKEAREEPEFEKKYSVLTVKYNDRFYWFEGMILLRKASIVCVNLFAGAFPSLQGLLGIAILGAATMVQFALKPFRMKSQNRLEGILLIISLLLLLSGMVYVSGTLTELQDEVEAAWTFLTTAVAISALVWSVLFLMRDQYHLILKRKRFSEVDYNVQKMKSGLFGSMSTLVQEDHAAKLRDAIDEDLEEDETELMQETYDALRQKKRIHHRDDFDMTVHELSRLVNATVKRTERTNVLAFLLNEGNDFDQRKELQAVLSGIEFRQQKSSTLMGLDGLLRRTGSKSTRSSDTVTPLGLSPSMGLKRMQREDSHRIRKSRKKSVMGKSLSTADLDARKEHRESQGSKGDSGHSSRVQSRKASLRPSFSISDLQIERSESVDSQSDNKNLESPMMLPVQVVNRLQDLEKEGTSDDVSLETSITQGHHAAKKAAKHWKSQVNLPNLPQDTAGYPSLDQNRLQHTKSFKGPRRSSSLSRKYSVSGTSGYKSQGPDSPNLATIAWIEDED